MHTKTNQRKLKICHVITRMNLGGAEENTLLSCMGLIAKGHEVTLVTGLSTGPEGNLLKHADTTGLKIIEVPDIVRPISPWKDWKAYVRLRQIFREHRFDVVHTHASKAGILGRLAASREQIPFIAHTVHGQAFHRFQSSFKNLLFKTAEFVAARHCHCIFAVAQAMIDQCVEAHIAPRDKYRLVYSGMNLNAFLNARPSSELRAQLGLPVGVPVVGVVARMFPQKGYEDFLTVAQIIGETIDDVHFLLVGDGAMRPKIQRRLGELGLGNRTIFTGMVPPEEVANYLPFMNVLLHLSLHEGLPRTAVQALAAKVPVVAYPVDGTPEVVVNGETGYLVPTRNTRMAAEKAMTLIRVPKRRIDMGRKGQEKVRGLFDTQRMVDKLEHNYLQGLKQQAHKKG